MSGATKICRDCPAPVTGRAFLCTECAARVAREKRRKRDNAYRARKRQGQALATVKGNGIGTYEQACKAVAAAKTVDVAKGIKDRAEALRVYGRQAGNRDLEIDAAEIRFRAERRVGELLIAAKDAGQLGTGRPEKNGSDLEPFSRVTLEQAGISKKLSSEAQKLARIEDFETRLDDWRTEAHETGGRVPVTLLRGPKAPRREGDAYYTPPLIVQAVMAHWWPLDESLVWEPFAGDGRFAEALRARGHEVIAGDIDQGQDFFAYDTAPAPGLCSNPPFDRARDVIDHAFSIGVTSMALVLPERFWASDVGLKQFARHKPAVWANLSWREDYLGSGGSPDRALAVGIWQSRCAESCYFAVWGRP